jgi:hypothetical protein
MIATQSDVLASLSRIVQSSSQPGGPNATLGIMTAAAKESIPGVDAVSVSVKDSRGAYRTLAPTDQLADDADWAQYDLGEGPCMDAASGEQMVYSGRIGNDGRYRRYGPQAADLGVVSQLAFEMFTADGTFGGLNLYARSADAFDDDVRGLAELFAHQGAAAMGYAAKVRTYNQALSSRQLIGEAVGLIMERHTLDETGAFHLLSRLSQTGNIKLRTLAAEIVESVNEKARNARSGT